MAIIRPFISKYLSSAFVFFVMVPYWLFIFFNFRSLAAKMYVSNRNPVCPTVFRIYFSALQVCSLCHPLVVFVFCFMHNLLGAICYFLVRGWLGVLHVSLVAYFPCHSLMQNQWAEAKESALFQSLFFPLLLLKKVRNYVWNHLWNH